MLNVGKLQKGQEQYYLESVARGAEDYYLGSGEAPGRWIGGGSKELELSGQVQGEELVMVLAGADPRSGAQLIPDRIRPRVPGFDLTFRAPKSVSLLFALGEPGVSEEVRDGHDAAVVEALGYLEREAALGRRRTDDGIVHVQTSGFVAAAFRHRTSRAGDPALHTHALVANLVRAGDGRWGAFDAAVVFAHAKTAGYLYQAHLRYELTRRLGVEWTDVHNGTAEVVGIQPSVLRAFSRRRQEIEERMAERGESSAAAAQVAALDTRAAKDYGVEPEALFPGWRERARQLGLGARELAATLRRTVWRQPTAREVAEMGRELSSPTGLCAESSSFSRRDAVRGWSEQLRLGAPVTEVERFTDWYLSEPGLAVPLAEGRIAPRTGDVIRRKDGRAVPVKTDPKRFSTPEMLATEEALVRSAESRLGARVGVATEGALGKVLAERTWLSPEQVDMITTITRTPAGVVLVQGHAGTGKTYALDAARVAWQSSGLRVVGTSLSAEAARGLQAGAGIQSYTVDRLLLDLDDPEHGGFARGTVLVVDEAGMVGTRKMRRLLEHAERGHAKVVLVGDDKQLPEIDAGGAFRGLQRRLGAAELVENRRQEQAWEREALTWLREGEASRAVSAYQSKERVVTGDSVDEVRRQLVEDWWQAKKAGEPALMIAARRADVADLNSRARALMDAAGELGEGSITLRRGTFSPGDRVMTLKNSRGLGVTNGTRGNVETVDPERRTLTFRTDDGRSIALPQSYLEAGHVTHAYAITGHKAQGKTTTRAFVLGDDTAYREWGYVALSRGTKENRLYVVSSPDEADELGHEAETARPDVVHAFTQAVSRSRAKEMALDVAEPTREQVLHRRREELERRRDSGERLSAGELEDLARLRRAEQRVGRGDDQRRRDEEELRRQRELRRRRPEPPSRTRE